MQISVISAAHNLLQTIVGQAVSGRDILIWDWILCGNEPLVWLLM